MSAEAADVLSQISWLCSRISRRRVAREDDLGLPGKGMRVRGFQHGVGRQPAETFPVVGVFLLGGKGFELLAGEPRRLDRGVVDELAPGGQRVGGRDGSVDAVITILLYIM